MLYNHTLRFTPPRCQAASHNAPLKDTHHAIKQILDDRIPPFQRKLFVMGLGYTGVAAARYLQHLDWHVAGTCRRPQDVDMLRSQGIEAYEYDTELHDSFSACSQALSACPYLLVTVPPTADGIDPVLAAHGDLLAGHLSTQLRWLGYLSSTSVYGDHGGRVVDERSPCTPEHGSKGWARLRAEQQWQALHAHHHMPVHTFRLGGIYGPARSALDAVMMQQQQQQQSASGPSKARRARQRYTARVHVGDICRVLATSMAHPAAGEVYNVVDDDPASRGVVMDFARGLLGVEDDRLGIRATLARAAAAKGGVDGVVEDGVVEDGSTGNDAQTNRTLPEKRVSNAKLKADLEVQLWYPTYREGLTAIHEQEPEPFFYVGVEEEEAEAEQQRPSAWGTDDASFSIDSFSSTPSFF